MRILSLLLLFLSLVHGNSMDEKKNSNQEDIPYKPFVEEGKEFLLLHIGGPPLLNSNANIDTVYCLWKKIIIGKDTIINEDHYNIVNTISIRGLRSNQFIRENENKEVFVWHSNGNGGMKEEKLYEFNAKVNDTTDVKDLVVDSIGVFENSGIKRQIFHISLCCTEISYRWVTGLGNMMDITRNDLFQWCGCESNVLRASLGGGTLLVRVTVRDSLVYLHEEYESFDFSKIDVQFSQFEKGIDCVVPKKN